MSTKKDIRRNGTLTARRVHEYWLRRATTEKEELTKLIGENAVENIILGDGKECYACGSTKHLNKCHVTPNSCGGLPNDPSNLFMMCSDCHQSNPDTIYTDMFWHYVKHREPYLNSSIKEIHKILNEFTAIASDEQMDLLKKFSDLEYSQKYKLITNIPHMEFSTTLNNQTTMSTHMSLLWKHITKGDWAKTPATNVLGTVSDVS